MPLLTKRKVFFITADTNDVLSGDNELGQLGAGTYKICALAAAAADATITVNDGSSNVLNAVPIPVKAAAVTYPQVDQDDPYWLVRYNGRGSNLVINVADGTNAEITLLVEKVG